MSTFSVVGTLVDFGNTPRPGVKVRATATPGLKIGDEGVHSNEPEMTTSDETGAFEFELVTLPGVWYRISTPFSEELRVVNLAGYIPDPEDTTTGNELPDGTVIDIRDILNEDPTPGYEAIAYAGPPNEITLGSVTTGDPGTDADVVVSGIAPSQVISFVIPRGDKGETGDVGPANILHIGSVSTGPAGSNAAVSITGSSPDQSLSIVIPRGDKGDKGDKGSKGDIGPVGPANILSVGDVTTSPPGSDVEIDIHGAWPNQTIDFEIPRGDKGEPNTLVIGTVVTSAPESEAHADIHGVAPNQTLDLVLPRGDSGFSRYLVHDGLAYPERPMPLDKPATFVGPVDPTALMMVGDTWVNTAADNTISPYVKHYEGLGPPTIAAQVGSRYIDINATCGAVEWIKASGTGTTGWVVAYGDTGWRNDFSSLLTQWAAWAGTCSYWRSGEDLSP